MNHDYHGAVECKTCHSVYPYESVPDNCTNCGAKLELPKSETAKELYGHEKLSPLINSIEELMEAQSLSYNIDTTTLGDRVKGPVTCCWCGEYYKTRDARVNCDSCGGTLPMPGCADPGEKPPKNPRKLPSGYWFKLFIKQNITLRVGLFLFILFSILSFLMPLCLIGVLISIAILIDNYKRLNNSYQALKDGNVLLGKVERVQVIGEANEPKNTEMGKVDSGLGFRVYFYFEVHGQICKGVKDTHDPIALTYFTGQAVWVVHNNKKSYSLWPPIA